MRKLAVTKKILATTALAWTCAATVGYAAEVTAPTPADQASAVTPTPPAATGLSDIIVTARKRVESSQDIPVAITTISAATINRYDLTSLERVAATTPEFSVARAPFGSGAQLTLRGIGSNSNSIGIEQSVAVVVDGVYYGQGRVINEGFFDLSRLEILKGPQALFYGKNATAGVISITTADPTDKREISLRTGYEFNSQNLYGEAIFSGPVTDTLGVRVAVRGSNMFGGYFHNLAVPTTYPSFDAATGTTKTYTASPANRNEPGEKDLTGRITVKWKPTDRLTATLKISGNQNKVDDAGYSSVLYNCPNGYNQANAANQCARKFQTYNLNPPDGVTIPFAGSDNKNYDKYKSYSVSGTVSYDVSNVEITSVSNYNWNRNKWVFDSSYVDAPNFIPASENTSYRAFSTELRALTKYDGPLNALLGGYYQSTKRIYDQAVALGNVQDSSQSPQNQFLASSKNSQSKGETLSAYGQAIWKIVPQLELTAGLRYIHETKDSYFVQPYVNALLTGIFIPNTRITANQSFNDWSPDLTLTYKPARNVTLYGAYKQAYKSGGFDNGGILGANTTAAFFTFNPEKARGFEVGLKTTLLDNQLRFNVGVYDYKFSNLQVDYFDAVKIALVTTNAGFARTRGVELEAELAPRAIPGLDLHATVNYNRARYGSFIAPCYGGESIAAGCNLAFDPVAQIYTKQDLSGTPTSVAPLWTGALGGTYDTAISSALNFGISADARYSDSYLASPFGTPSSRNPSYVSIDGSIRLRTTDDRYEVALIGKNLTNHFYVTGGIDATNTGSGTGTASAIPSDQIGFAGLPRTVQLQFTAHF